MFFKDFTDQKKIARVLSAGLEQNRLAHALLFTGPAGSHQTDMATTLTQALFCAERQGVEPCGACNHCRRVQEKTHPDLIWISPAEDSRVIKIEEIRALISRAALKPMEAAAKVFVIEPAEAMNESSQNALLKTLEEPEGRAHLILISYEPEKLLPTIHSRCQMLRFLPIRRDEALSPELIPLRRALFSRILQYLGDAEGSLPDLALGSLEREDLIKLFNYAIDYFRDVLVVRSGAEAILSAFEDSVEKRRIAEFASEDSLLETLEILADIREKILQYMNLRLLGLIVTDRFASAKLLGT